MFQRINWVLGGGFKGGVDAEEDADDEGGEEGDEDDFPTNEGGKWGDSGDDEGKYIAEGETKNTAKNRENESFKEELHQDVARRGADGFADTDFVVALRDRY